MLWGGRFKEQLNNKALEFSSSIHVDINLIHEDLQVSCAHAEMLFKIHLINQEERDSIIKGLKTIQSEWEKGNWTPDINKFEDIHSAIESRLGELIGSTAGKLHTGRSRNDLVATSMRLWIKKACHHTIKQIKKVQRAFIEIASGHTETLMPGYTHLQRAQPVSFAFHLLAYVEMFERDRKRFDHVLHEANESPLGSGALAGSTLHLDREFTAKLLGFHNPSSNAMDAISDRDFMIDFLNACSIGMMHLSRFAEELVLWSSAEWKFVRLSDEYTTGSSLMPQKKNPDMAELIRGRAGKTFGNYLSLISTMKGLPLSYNRDMQEDKEPVFQSFKIYTDALSILEPMIKTATVNKDRFTELANDPILSTDLADWLVLKGIPFRQAHEIVGKLVKCAEDRNIPMKDLTLEDLKSVNPGFDKSALDCLNIEKALYRKKTSGSPNPDMVKDEIEKWKNRLSIS